MAPEFTEAEIIELISCVKFMRSNLETLVGHEYANPYGPDYDKINNHEDRIKNQDLLLRKLRSI